MELTFFFKSFIALFTIIDPVGAIPFFLTLTLTYSDKERQKIVFKASLTSLVILTFFLWLGPKLLSFFQISLSSFMIAGGILLFFTAMEMLFGKTRSIKTSPKEVRESSIKEDISVVPLGIPYLAGPGAITTIIILTEGKSWMEKFTVFLALILVLFFTYFLLVFSQSFYKILGELGTKAIERVLGLILASIAIEYIFKGIKNLLFS